MEYGYRVDADKVSDLEQRRLITVRKHPKYPLRILNYTADVQQGWLWQHEPFLLHCRGLVIDDHGYVVAVPFKKFFNHGDSTGGIEPEGTPIITEKLDGSMILSFMYNGELITATRGTFDSPQAQLAKTLLPIDHQVHGSTFLWELIGPSNRHVVDYPTDMLVCLGIITRYGTDLWREGVEAEGRAFGFPVVERHDLYIHDILKMDEQNKEGFIYTVEHPMDGVVFRSKIKFPTYITAHRVVSRENWYKQVHEAWANCEVEPLLDILPESYRREVMDYLVRLERRADYVDSEVSSLMDRCTGDPTDRVRRAEMAKIINQHNDIEVRHATFARLNGKKYTIKAL